MQDLLNQAALQANGFIDQQASYRTLDNGLLECNVRLRFSDIQSCLAWIDSPIRRRLLNEAETNFVCINFNPESTSLRLIFGWCPSCQVHHPSGRWIWWFGLLSIQPWCRSAWSALTHWVNCHWPLICWLALQSLWPSPDGCLFRCWRRLIRDGFKHNRTASIWQGEALFLACFWFFMPYSVHPIFWIGCLIPHDKCQGSERLTGNIFSILL